ncbi:transposase is4 [Holotrichia oblita]|uniref:Transposase is4 n=1 Tax=Holotrichia oblita TaxID=644536 RepID=A0ACB9SQU5_HOLOL|nr:transposase is4 [Holotrichia oblita]
MKVFSISESDDSEDSDSSSVEEQGVNSDWGVVVGDPKAFNFDEDIGLVKEIQDMRGKDIFSYYRLFLDEELITTLVTETNLYAEQTIVQAIVEETLMPSSRLNKWKNVTREEMYCFLGFLLWMGLDKKLRFVLFSNTFQSKNIDEYFDKKFKNFDSSSLPPCKVELQQHLLRVRYVTKLWRNSHLKHTTSLSPVASGWTINDNKYDFVWFVGAITIPSC